MREFSGSLILAVLGDSSYVIEQNTTCPQEVGIDRGGFAEVRPLASVTERGCTVCNAVLWLSFQAGADANHRHSQTGQSALAQGAAHGDRHLWSTGAGTRCR